MNTQFFVKPVLSQWQRALANKHTSGAAIVFAAAAGIEELSKIWCSPAIAVKVESSIKVVEHIAVVYGLVMAGDAGATSTPSGIQQGQIQPPQSNPPEVQIQTVLSSASDALNKPTPK